MGTHCKVFLEGVFRCSTSLICAAQLFASHGQISFLSSLGCWLYLSQIFFASSDSQHSLEVFLRSGITSINALFTGHGNGPIYAFCTPTH